METIFVSCGSTLDQGATGKLIAEVALRTTGETQVVVVSLAAAHDLHWGALRRLARAGRCWRAASRGVVIETSSRPSQRSLLTAAGVLAAAT